MSIGPIVLGVVLSGVPLLVFGAGIIERRFLVRPLADARVAAMQGEIAPTAIARPPETVPSQRRNSAPFSRAVTTTGCAHARRAPSSTITTNREREEHV